MSINKTKSTRLAPLEFRLLREIGESMRGEKVLVACSGGRDSIALASVLIRLAPRAGFEISGLAFVHHGPSVSKVVTAYRERALRFVREFAKAHDVSFAGLGPSPVELSSEQDMRRFRLDVLKAEATTRGSTAIAFAHHADDLFETRLIRLMRGTGASGLEAMTIRKGHTWRPLLSESRESIAAYAKDQRLEWVEDPTNADVKPLRNWIRAELLPLIESKRPGATSAMARSLALVVEELESVHETEDMPSETAKLDRSIFESLPYVERKRELSRYASRLGARDLTSNQIEEIAKRLSSFQAQRRRSGTFVVMGLEWSVSTNEIHASRVLMGERVVLS